ncbi:uncharacterized protein LOC109541182 [Dendroctonus ponderosae]|uniref:MARVEL domain-containing protein n=1 Tax=Dendroctonus ponderosae TaxID=77166 RepID=A0AAR5PX55_DENPD|nr:uncharacterized protein LOC109541182 [Dendroctonus ponderosae]XP_019765528.1 uncharacterized protein LOC109541182 [Dendroctonus ponderosae]KAH1023540.1 hypothetical protein HUJ04_012725 [Dendroctonus ponderosae]KAH1023541.1 hypothetical protein HUJ04_012725 [Dendroctonus ponderosae]KAH1029990.1 hypothetical protein HUJ05_003131 [Dendroctonus ponderosae]KAH1029991.1 hypothetical protein HUJ05_003131 [Dendroctonus ponderosae]
MSAIERKNVWNSLSRINMLKKFKSLLDLNYSKVSIIRIASECGITAKEMKIICLVSAVLGLVPLILSADPAQKIDDIHFTLSKNDFWIIAVLVAIILTITLGVAAHLYNTRNANKETRKLHNLLISVLVCVAFAAFIYLLSCMVQNELLKYVIMSALTSVLCSGFMIGMLAIVSSMRPNNELTRHQLDQYVLRLLEEHQLHECGTIRQSGQPPSRTPLLSSPRVSGRVSTTISLQNNNSLTASNVNVHLTPPTPVRVHRSLPQIPSSTAAALSLTRPHPLLIQDASSSRHAESPLQLSASSSSPAPKLTGSLSRGANSSLQLSPSRRAEPAPRLTDSLSRGAKSSLQLTESSWSRPKPPPRLTEPLLRGANFSLQFPSSIHAEPSPGLTDFLSRAAESSLQHTASSSIPAESSPRFTEPLSRYVKPSKNVSESAISLPRNAESSWIPSESAPRRVLPPLIGSETVYITSHAEEVSEDLADPSPTEMSEHDEKGSTDELLTLDKTQL